MICDNTFATPINCQPFQFGVDIVTHSTTKYMDGHAMHWVAVSWTVETLTGKLTKKNFRV